VASFGESDPAIATIAPSDLPRVAPGPSIDSPLFSGPYGSKSPLGKVRGMSFSEDSAIVMIRRLVRSRGYRGCAWLLPVGECHLSVLADWRRVSGPV